METILVTERLLLKKTSYDEFDEVLKLRSDSDVMKYTEQGAQTKEAVQRFFEVNILCQNQHGYDVCSVFEKESHAFIGQAGLFFNSTGEAQSETEIGFSLHKAYWGKAYATEIVSALIQWGFTHLSIANIFAYTHPDNIASQRVLQKCGMKKIGVAQGLFKFEISRR